MTREEIDVILHKMTKEQIIERAKTLRPVADFGKVGGMRYWIDGNRIATQSYTWNLKKIKPTPYLKEIARIKTYHRGSRFFFKPSVDECVLQCPDDNAVAFQIIKGTADYDYDTEYWECETIYYAGDMPKDVKDREIEW